MPLDYHNPTNPGQELQELLMRIYPLGSIQRLDKSFIVKIDRDCRADGEFVELVYKSSINYLVRRLIRTAQYFKKMSGSTSDTLFYKDLRNFLQNEVDIPKGNVEQIFILLLECINASEKKPTQKTKKRIIRKASENNSKCYICGCDLDFTQVNTDLSVEVEHIWPNSLGGDSSDPNLVACCRKCNQSKHDLIEANDYHYEEISYSTEEFPIERTMSDRQHRVALWAKNHYRCNYGRCKSMPSWSGELLFRRKNENDSWHYLNIEAYCAEHITK